MKLSRSTIIALVVLALWLVLSWELGLWLGVRPPALYYLRAGLWIIALVGFAGFLILRPKEASDAVEKGMTATDGDIESSFGEAGRRVQAGSGIRQLNALPTIFLIGDSGSAKTSILANSGLEPELLAGQAHEDHSIAPTRVLNLWYSRRTLFIDPAGASLVDASTRRKLFRKFMPTGMKAIIAGQTPASRSVVVTLDCGTFFGPGGAEALAGKARQLHAALSELSQCIGSSLPVYVLFTKADLIPYFQDFVEILTDSETVEILGSTLRVDSDQGKGAFAELQRQRISDAFQELYYTLCDKRPSYLARQHDPGKLPNIYEFPREFGKLRPLLIQFLVDLCRPSQLGTSPFLRGFYFTGVRPVTISDLAPAVQAPRAKEQTFGPGATRMFVPRSGTGALQSEVRAAGPRKIPQWVFLGRLFSDLILTDRAASAVTQQNIKVNFVRRLLLVAAAALPLLMAIWWAISWANNRALVRDAVDAARAVPTTNLPSGELVSAEALRRLTRIRDTLAVIDTYRRKGVPSSYDAFLYTGDAIREPLRTTYYSLFRKLLLSPAQNSLLAVCSKPAAYDTQGYRYVYDALKAYLVTTNHHEKSTAEFLAPVLLLHWQDGHQIDSERLNLARQNFELYAEELPEQNPYPALANPDSDAVETARTYLKGFAQEERIYQSMLLAAGNSQKPLVFNLDFPGSAQTVINNYKVDPGFTKPGYANFLKQLQDPERYFAGEEWVLGKQAFAGYNKTTLVQNLTAHYGRDFIKTWQDYLRSTSVVGYQSVPDAVNKLDRLSGPQSTLLQALCVASDNTSIPAKELSQVFQPVQFVAPPGCSQKLVGPSNSGYLQGLIGLKAALQAVGPIGNADPTSVVAANSSATQADSTVSTLALNFTPSPLDPKSVVLAKTTHVLRDPISRVPPLLKGAGAGPVNSAAGAVCAAVEPLLRKYPFNPHSSTDATLQELSDFLRPQEGRLWQLYNRGLKPFLIRSGNNFVAASGQQLAVTPAFLSFFNRAAHLSEALYSAGGPNPNFTFSMQLLPSQDVGHVSLAIDGQIAGMDLKNGGVPASFVWPGAAQSASLGVRFGNSPEFSIAQTSGLWSAWRLIETGERLATSSGQIALQWTLKTQAGATTSSGRPLVVRLSLDPRSSDIFRSFLGINCVSKAVQ